jgi:predicted TIM-barrel fold metal-dependent hydrolase
LNFLFFLFIRLEFKPKPIPMSLFRHAKRANDFLCENVIARHPDRYAGFAAVPLQNPEAAADELERCVKQLGFKGAMVNGYSNIQDENTGEYTDEPQFEVFWAKVAELDVPIYLHPRDPLRASKEFTRDTRSF